MARLSRRWEELRELVWQWDPIGIGPPSTFTADEYECILELVVPFLQRGAPADEITEALDRFLPEHFGLAPQSEAANVFATAAQDWWRQHHP